MKVTVYTVIRPLTLNTVTNRYLIINPVQNLGHLIRMPYGCGEQNMLNFAPNIYLLRYLDTTLQGTPEATTKLMRYMRTGN